MGAMLYKAEDLIAGRFQVQCRIDSYGQGSVYEVKDLETGEVLALKAVDQDDRRQAERLRGEFEP